MLRATQAETAVGPVTIISSDSGIVRVAFAEESPARVREEVAIAAGLKVVDDDDGLRDEARALARHVATGDATLPALDLRLVRGAFRRSVLDALSREVPRGETVTYGQLARYAGRPAAARAAGTACARNPLPLLIPCHRVVPGSGGIGSYGGGAERKRALLALEGCL